jgi:iron complex transport system ATP-binding protein
MRLAAQAVSVELKGRRVLESVSVALGEGRITGLIGHNGAGKSTLLKTLAGLLKPSQGAVTLDGQPLADIARRLAGRRIAYLPQDRIVHWGISVRAVAALGRLPHGSTAASVGAADREAVAAALAAMDLAAIADRPIDQVSGGERARALFARALAQEAPVILADEPTAGLDPAHALELFAILQKLAMEGRTIAIALHDLSMAARFCHDIVLLHSGRVEGAGPTAEVLSAERISRAFSVHMRLGQFDNIPIVVPIAPLRP